jgi:hypothetical protein
VGEPEAGYAEHDAALWRRYLILFGAGAGRKIGLRLPAIRARWAGRGCDARCGLEVLGLAPM